MVSAEHQVDEHGDAGATCAVRSSAETTSSSDSASVRFARPPSKVRRNSMPSGQATRKNT